MNFRAAILCLTASFLPFSLVDAEEDAWLIVPGKSVGKISLGMPQAEVFKRLGAPQMQSDFEQTDRRAYPVGESTPKLPSLEGVTQSDWTTAWPVPKKVSGAEDDHAPFLCDFLTIYLRDEKVIQIEVRVPRFRTAEGLSLANKEGEWRKRFPQVEEFFCHYHHPSAGGVPAGKHFVSYADDRKDGIGWSADGFGNLAPNVEFESNEPLYTLIVHPPGERLLPDPDGGSRFIWKLNP